MELESVSEVLLARLTDIMVAWYDKKLLMLLLAVVHANIS